jgi:DmsE family decaheme c-type cytochrome
MHSRAAIAIAFVFVLSRPGPAWAAGTKAPASAPSKTAKTPSAKTVPAATEQGAVSPEKHKLKPGAEGQLCLGCHVDFEDQLKKASVHTPVRTRKCTGCHNPHTSEHGKLLADEPAKTCFACHDKIVPAAAKSSHKPITDRGCVACHQPHASQFKPNLNLEQGELCKSCHLEVVKTATSSRYKHRPVVESCVTCHDPHGSAVAESLLKENVPSLCTHCHKVESDILMKKHVGYNVSKARCTSCHDVHGSDTRGMLYQGVHSPVAKGMCGQCHEPPGNPAGFATKAAGGALCYHCHAQKIDAMNAKDRVHRPVAEGACLRCHTPHASTQKALVARNLKQVCGDCHGDTVQRQVRSPAKHAPVNDGKCTSCHDPHGGSEPLLLNKASIVETCGTCHDWHKHSTHPIGDKVVDPRNKNARVSCISCHRAHGTEFAKLMPQPTTTEVCTQCHSEYKR